MAVTLASVHLDDQAFLSAFEDCSLPLASFRHGDHLRYGWLQLHQTSFDNALLIIGQGIQRYARHHGVIHIFHHTLTRGWVTLLASHNETTFTDFLQQNQSKLNRDLLHRFWTPEALDSDAAKFAWLPPDRAQLPCTCFTCTSTHSH